MTNQVPERLGAAMLDCMREEGIDPASYRLRSYRFDRYTATFTLIHEFITDPACWVALEGDLNDPTCSEFEQGTD